MKRNILPGIVFLTILFALSAAFLLTPPKLYSVHEKRFLSTAPQIDAQTIRDAELSQKLETYMADQFPLRDLFVGISAYFDLLTGKNTAQDVLVGHDGWLFAAPAAYSNDKLSANLAAVEAFAAKTEVAMYCVIVPESASVYAEYLPNNAPEYRDAEILTQVEETLNAAQYIDAASALESAKSEQLYYKTDHHLTSAGSYVLYTSLCDALGLAPVPKDAFEIEIYADFYGTAWSSAGYWLHETDTIELWRWDGDDTVVVTIPENEIQHDGIFFTEHLAQEDQYPVFLDGNHALTQVHNPNGEGTLVLVKDSFAHCAAGFLAQHYRDIYLVDLRYYKGEILALVEDVRADAVLILYGVANLTTDSSLVWLR